MIWALLKKEILDSVRDKRSVTAALLGAMIGPFIMVAMFSFSIEQSRSQDTLYVDIENAELAPQIVELFDREDIKHFDMPEEGDKIEVDGESETHSGIVIRFDESFAENLAKAKPAEVVITTDHSEKDARSKVSRVKKVLNQYQGAVVQMRLIARGISPNVANAIKVTDRDTSTPESKSGMLLGMMAVFILMSVFISSTNVAIDSSAGERERNSLELLLMQPVSTFDVVAAKTINTALFGMAGATLTLVLTAVLFPFVPLHKIGMAFNFDAVLALKIWLILLPLTLFAASFQLASAFHAKSFKEAQSYIQYSLAIPTVIPMMIEMMEYKHELLQWIPVITQQQAISQLVRGELESYLPVAMGFVVTLIVSLGISLFTARSLRSEKVVLGL